jgi:hypothetical protein
MNNLARMNYKGKGKWAHVAKALNDIGRVLNTLRGEGGVTVEQAGRELVVRAKQSAGPSLVNIFMARQTGPAEVGATGGYIFLRGAVEVPVPSSGTTTQVHRTDVSGFADGEFWLYVRTTITNAGVVGILCEAVHPTLKSDYDPNLHAFLILATGEVADGLITSFVRRYNGGDWYLHGL